MVLAGEHVATEGSAVRWLDRADAPDGTWIHLGEHDGRSHAAVLVDHIDERWSPQSVRAAAPALGQRDLSYAVHAVGIARWLQSTPYCPRCGALTDVRDGGHLRVCPSCQAHHFPRTDPAVIMLITDEDDRALLGHQANWPSGRWSTLAGFVEPGETLEDAVRRETAEETGVAVGEVSYGASQPWPFPASLMVGFFGRATSTDISLNDHELADARWVTRDELIDEGRRGTLLLPPAGVSISSWLVQTWLGRDLTGSWF